MFRVWITSFSSTLSHRRHIFSLVPFLSSLKTPRRYSQSARHTLSLHSLHRLHCSQHLLFSQTSARQVRDTASAPLLIIDTSHYKAPAAAIFKAPYPSSFADPIDFSPFFPPQTCLWICFDPFSPSQLSHCLPPRLWPRMYATGTPNYVASFIRKSLFSARTTHTPWEMVSRTTKTKTLPPSSMMGLGRYRSKRE